MLKISVQEASSLLGVHADTLRRWEEEGKIISERTSGGPLNTEALLTPAIWAQQGYYRQLGMRDRSPLLAFILYLGKTLPQALRQYLQPTFCTSLSSINKLHSRSIKNYNF